VNLSKVTLNTLVHNILEKGLIFVVVPNKILVEELVCNIESSLISKKIENVEVIRQECMVVLRSSKPPKNNLSKDERKYLWDLRNNKYIKILKANKGNTTIIMDEVDYHKKLDGAPHM
jgi:hypothetical protein